MSPDADAVAARVTFYDAYAPTLKTGEYTLGIAQELAVDAARTASDGGDPHVDPQPQAPASQRIIVRGPRFKLDPADVHRQFPPPDAPGEYHRVLPMLVLNRRSLPWERELAGAGAAAPWVALVVLAEDEPDVARRSVPLAEAAHASFRGKPTAGPPAGTLAPTIALADDEDPAEIHCDVVDLPAATFAAVAPTLDDARLLAHVRHATTDYKEPDGAVREGWVATAVANRFPLPPPADSAEPRRNVAHLVSLEGLEPYLRGGAPSVPEGCTTVRMISLHSWSFPCLAEPRANFRQLALNLLGEGVQGRSGMLLRIPLPQWAPFPRIEKGPEAVAHARLAEGYAPLEYRTHSGESTFGWYRGPLSPVPVERVAEPRRVPLTASEAMVYDPVTGLFDQSYAVAWQTGRSLALASVAFATTLLQLRRGTHALVDRLAEALHDPACPAIDLAAATPEQLGDLAQGGGGAAALARFAVGAAGERALGAVGNAEPAFDPAPPPPRRPPVTPEALAALMEQPAVTELLEGVSAPAPGANALAGTDDALPRQVVEWLARKALLHDIPFEALVPNERMLPVESLRFFHVDRNWIDALIDGALGVGLQSSRDSALHATVRGALGRAVDDVVAGLRDRRRGVEPEPEPQRPAVAGFLLRSAIVSGWPGLEVRAFAAADPARPMKPLRLDRVSPNTMIGLYPELPVRVELNEPSEGLVFGLEDDGIGLRHLPGLPGTAAGDVGRRIDPPRVLGAADVYALRRPHASGAGSLRIAGEDGLARAIERLLPGGAARLGPAALALEMVRVPEQLLLEPTEEPPA